MSTNTERADFAQDAVLTFCLNTRRGPASNWLKYKGEDHADLVADLICDLGHYAERNGLDFKTILERGAGMWSAERRAPLSELGNEPEGGNDIATLEIVEDR